MEERNEGEREGAEKVERASGVWESVCRRWIGRQWSGWGQSGKDGGMERCRKNYVDVGSG